jgi:hypothetical protein
VILYNNQLGQWEILLGDVVINNLGQWEMPKKVDEMPNMVEES